ncbi:MAG: YfhO family protein, partial [Maribacter sp.]
ADENLRMTRLEELPEMLRLDRQAVYTSDLLRSLGYVIVTAGLLWFYLKQKLSKNVLIIAVGLLVVADLVAVDWRYVNNDSFVSQRRMREPFQETAADKEIANDEGVFRVFDQSDGFNSAKTAYFHQSITGYHAAKPAGMQDLFDFHIYNGNLSILNMLNIKYVVRQDEEGNAFPIENPNANGNAWFIKELKPVPNADAEIMALDSLDTKNTAVLNTSKFEGFNELQFQVDSTASISLTNYEPNHLTYASKNANEGVAVFSEMYYENGWNAYIDGRQTDYFRVNYVLRALKVPSGAHKIEFKFEPEVVAKGGKITLASTLLLGLIIIGGIGFSFWNFKKEKKS